MRAWFAHKFGYGWTVIKKWKKMLTYKKWDVRITLALKQTRNWIRRGIEVVITRRSWKPFVRKGAWVRIPPSPFIFLTFFKKIISLEWKSGNWLNSSRDTSCGEVPKLAEGTPLERVQVGKPARGFKSLLLRFLVIKTFLKNIKKLLTSRKTRDIIIKLTAGKRLTKEHW